MIFVIGPCFSCHRPFGFNPYRVPSIVVEGVREPICPDCVEKANPRRIANGLEPITPLPGAYEPAEEGSEWLEDDQEI